LIDATSQGKDQLYANSLESFLSELKRFNLGQERRRRIAWIITKAEQPEIIINRYELAGFIHKKRFPKTYQKLQEWQNAKEGKIEVNFFLASAFGTVGGDMKGNYKNLSRQQGGTQSVIRYPQQWRPFGLVAPLYWLCTGKRHDELD
jgi:hypothetical protein